MMCMLILLEWKISIRSRVKSGSYWLDIWWHNIFNIITECTYLLVIYRKCEPSILFLNWRLKMIAGMDLFKYYIALLSFFGFLQNRGNAQQVYLNRKPNYYPICNKLYYYTIILNIDVNSISDLRWWIMRINLYNLLKSLYFKQFSINEFFFVWYL